MSVEERRLGTWHVVGLETVREHWAWLLGLGFAMILLGVGAIAAPGMATLATEILIGWVLLIGGIVHVIGSAWTRPWSGFFVSLLTGVVYLIAGAILLAYPLTGVLALTILLGMFFLVIGAFEMTTAFALRPLGSWSLMLASGILSLIVAFLILAQWPDTAAWAIGLLVGIYLLWGGIARVSIALMARQERGHAVQH